MAYPASYDSFRPTQNRPGIVYDPNKSTTLFSEDLQNLQGNIQRTQETLGLNPQGEYATIAERLADMGGGGGTGGTIVGSIQAAVRQSNETANPPTTFSCPVIDQGDNWFIKGRRGFNLSGTLANNLDFVLQAPVVSASPSLPLSDYFLIDGRAPNSGITTEPTYIKDAVTSYLRIRFSLDQIKLVTSETNPQLTLKIGISIPKTILVLVF